VGAAYSAIKSAGQAERVAVGSNKQAAEEGGADLAQKVADYEAYRASHPDMLVAGPGGGGKGPHPEVNAQLPNSGTGFVVNDAGSDRHYGTAKLVNFTVQLGDAWSKQTAGGQPVPRLVIGDMSVEGGGHISPHRAHDKGLDVDIQIIRADLQEPRGALYRHASTDPTSPYHANYSRQNTQQLIDTIHAVGGKDVQYIFSQDKQLQGSNYEANHVFHVHVRLFK